MRKVSIIIPFRDQGDRSRQLEWLRRRYEALAPDFEVIVEPDDGREPFSKTIAVNNGFKKATGDILAVIDADVWVERQTIEEAASMIRSRRAVWVRPAATVLRLSEETTWGLIEQPADIDTPDFLVSQCDAITQTVGLAFVVSADHFADLGGMDPRFRGWGWEDNAFNDAMRCLHGREVVFDRPLVHLWHPRPKDQNGRRVWANQGERNATLGTRYKRARRDPAAMRKLVTEYRRLSKIRRRPS
jgi:glycosyltransferase involved in cell wall biosynthesis